MFRNEDREIPVTSAAAELSWDGECSCIANWLAPPPSPPQPFIQPLENVSGEDAFTTWKQKSNLLTPSNCRLRVADRWQQRQEKLN